MPTIQAILTGGLQLPGAAVASVRRQAVRDLDQPRLRRLGRHLLALAVHGRDLGGAFGALVTAVHPVDGVTVTTCAMIGMAAMVGGGTGAAMTAVTMIFEMTRDYDLVMPSIVAVALAIGVRRLLSAGEHLHRQARRPRPFRAEGHARQHVSGAPRRAMSWSAM